VWCVETPEFQVLCYHIKAIKQALVYKNTKVSMHHHQKLGWCMEERLSDFSAKDSSNWDKKRGLAQTVEKIFYDSSEPVLFSQSKRLQQCSTFLTYSLKSDKTVKLKQTSFCKVRTCPVCSWRRSKMWQTRMFKALPELSEFRWLLLTLTVKNCEVSDLKATIKAMQSAWAKMRKRKMFSGVVVGYVKALEVTRAKDGKAHPHFHIMLLVKPSYFSHNYLTKNDWANEWQQVLNADYQPVCDVRSIKADKGKGIGGAVLEVLKYETKSADLVQHPDFLQQLALQLIRVRAIELGGLIKQKLKAVDDVEETNEMLISENLDDSDDVKEVAELVFGWQRFTKYYKLTQRNEKVGYAKEE
jgi:plasmid rolling circle replication initiator protein Rep